MFLSSTPHPPFIRLESYPFITPPLHPPLFHGAMLYSTQGRDSRADYAVLSPGLVNYNRELGLICSWGAPAHSILLLLAFSSFSPALSTHHFLLPASQTISQFQGVQARGICRIWSLQCIHNIPHTHAHTQTNTLAVAVLCLKLLVSARLGTTQWTRATSHLNSIVLNFINFIGVADQKQFCKHRIKLIKNWHFMSSHIIRGSFLYYNT